MVREEKSGGEQAVMRKRKLGAMTLSALLVLILAGMGFTPGGSVQAAGMPTYEVLPALDAAVDNPAAVAVDNQGRVYVAEQANNRIRIFSQRGDLLAQITGLAAPKSVAVDDAGNIYVGSQSQGNVTVLDSGRNFLRKLGAGDGEFLDPNDIDVIGGKIYVTDTSISSANSGAIKVYDPAGGLLGTIGAPGKGDGSNVVGQIWHPKSLAFDAATSSLVILDKKSVYDATAKGYADVPRIQYFSSIDGSFVRRNDKWGYNSGAGDLQSMSQQVTVDSASRVYVAESLANKVMVYANDATNTFLGAIYNSNLLLQQPKGLSMSPTGRLYVTSVTSGRVDVFGIENYSSMGIQPATLNFTATEGGEAPALQDATVANSGKADIAWTASTTTEWIKLPATTGTLAAEAAGTVPVEVLHDGLAPGSYKGSIKVSATGMEEAVTVNLTVKANPLQVNPASLSFTASEGATPIAQAVSIKNGGTDPLSWSAAADQAWIELSKNAGTAPSTVKVNANTTGLTVGSYNGTITFTNLAGGKGVSVPVDLTISAATAPPTAPPDLPVPGGNDVKAGGKNWSASQAKAGTTLRGVWGSGYRDILTVGDGGTILKYNGKSWTAQTSGTTSRLQSIWGAVTESSYNVYTVGDGGQVLHTTGASWNKVASNTTENLADIWGAGAEVMAAGNNGIILNLTKSTSAQEDIVLRSIWGSSATNVFAVGENGTVLHSDGTAWTAMVSDTTEWLNETWGDNQTGEVFAVGENGTIIHYDGTTWNPMVSGVSVTLHGVYGTAANNVYAVGDSGVVLHYDGAAWSVIMAGGTNLRDIWADDRRIVAVGENGIVLTGTGGDSGKPGRKNR